jgi:hypothetical protein
MSLSVTFFALKASALPFNFKNESGTYPLPGSAPCYEKIEPIGVVKTDVGKVPRRWTVSEAEGAILINEEYAEGLKNLKAGQRVNIGKTGA